MSKTSKFLSLVLRHRPEKIGIALDKAGWTPVDKLLKALGSHGHKISLDELKKVVATNDKKRFSFSEDGKLIRANQGHSVDVDLGYVEQQPPDQLFHGTVSKFLDAIFKDGLQKMSRHHVHLSKDRETAIKVGSRRGQPKILTIDSKAMFEDGHKFYVSENGVWLTDNVPPQYIVVNG